MKRVFFFVCDKIPSQNSNTLPLSTLSSNSLIFIIILIFTHNMELLVSLGMRSNPSYLKFSLLNSSDLYPRSCSPEYTPHAIHRDSSVNYARVRGIFCFWLATLRTVTTAAKLNVMQFCIPLSSFPRGTENCIRITNTNYFMLVLKLDSINGRN